VSSNEEGVAEVVAEVVADAVVDAVDAVDAVAVDAVAVDAVAVDVVDAVDAAVRVAMGTASCAKNGWKRSWFVLLGRQLRWLGSAQTLVGRIKVWKVKGTSQRTSELG
jgi:hypothetical protein